MQWFLGLSLMDWKQINKMRMSVINRISRTARMKVLKEGKAIRKIIIKL